MKNATKPPKRKLLGFAEQLGSTTTPTQADPSGVGLMKSPIAAGTRPASKAKKASVASASSEAPPAFVTGEPAAAPVVAPAPAIKAVSKETPVQVAKSKPGGGRDKFVLIALVVAVIVVAGPSLAVLVGTFAYPLIVLAAIVGVWKLYESSRSKGK